MKQKFNIITSTCVPLPLENVDTDQIIPARFLKATTREEKFFGDNLFRNWRSVRCCTVPVCWIRRSSPWPC